MQLQGSKESYVHDRKPVRRSRKKKVTFDRLPAKVESVADDGSALLHPAPKAQPAVTVTLSAGMTEQVSAESRAKNGHIHVQMPKNTAGSSMQCSPLIIGHHRHFCLGRKF